MDFMQLWAGPGHEKNGITICVSAATLYDILFYYSFYTSPFFKRKERVNPHLTPLMLS